MSFRLRWPGPAGRRRPCPSRLQAGHRSLYPSRPLQARVAGNPDTRFQKAELAIRPLPVAAWCSAGCRRGGLRQFGCRWVLRSARLGGFAFRFLNAKTPRGQGEFADAESPSLRFQQLLRGPPVTRHQPICQRPHRCRRRCGATRLRLGKQVQSASAQLLERHGQRMPFGRFDRA